MRGYANVASFYGVDGSVVGGGEETVVMVVVVSMRKVRSSSRSR